MSSEMSSFAPEVPTSSTSRSRTEEVHTSIDGADLARLLLCIGFTLQGTDKHGNLEDLHKLLKNKEENGVKVEITCVKSGTKLTLVKDGCCCKCPADEPEVWNVSAVSAQGNLSITKSNLVPTISSAKTKMINTLLLKCLEFIVFTNASDRNVDTFEDIKIFCGLSKTISTENVKIEHNISKITIGSSPPRHSSSPLPVTCRSLRDSRSSLGGVDSLVDVLKEIEAKTKIAIEMASKKNVTFTKSENRPSISPLASTSSASSFQANGNQSVVNCIDVKSTPISKTPKKQAATTGAKKRGLIPPSKLTLLKYKKDSASPSLGRTPTSSSMVKDRTGKSLNISAAKVKSAISVDANLQSKIKSRTGAFASKIALKK